MTATSSKTRPLNAKIWEREEDEHYVEPRWCSERLFEEEDFLGGILDPCCGFGRIVESARKAGHHAVGSDLIERAPGFMYALDFTSNDYPREILMPEHGGECANVVCNPPFNIAAKFAACALAWTPRKVAMVFPTARLNAAHWLKGTPLVRVWLMTPRPSMPPGHTITAGQKPGGGKADFCWLVWRRGHLGNPEMRWLRRDGDAPAKSE
jgi:hypothetical protein